MTKIALGLSSLVDRYKRLVSERRVRSYSSFLLTELSKRNSAYTLLELGSGTSPYSRAFRSARTIISLDLDARNLHNIAALACQERIVADVHYLPVRNSAIDVALAISIFEHVRALDIALGEVHRVLGSTGLLFCQIPNPQWFIEEHTGIPLIHLLPHRLRDLIMQQRTSDYVNLELSLKCFLKSCQTDWRVLDIHPIRLVFARIWPNGWFLKLCKREMADFSRLSRRAISNSKATDLDRFQYAELGKIKQYRC